MSQKPVKLNRLVEITKFQSTEASNKIEGIVTTNARMKQLFEERTTPRNRDEDEIMGYRDVLNTIHESYEYIPIRPSYKRNTTYPGCLIQKQGCGKVRHRIPAC